MTVSTLPPNKIHVFINYNGTPVPHGVVKMAEEAYGNGQPFMDNLVLVLLDKGARTPEQSARSMREGLLEECRRNPMLTPDEREGYWSRYNVPRIRRVVYRIEAWWNHRRLMRGAA